MFRKTMMMAVVVAVASSIAVPAIAMAQVWTDHTQAIFEDQQIDLTGSIKFESSFGNVECQIAAQLTMFAFQQTGAVTNVEPDLEEPESKITDKCISRGSLMACKVHKAEATEFGPRWTIHHNTQQIYGQLRTFDFTLEGTFCPAKKVVVTPSTSFAMLPNQPQTFTSFFLSGQTQIHYYSTHQGQTPFKSEAALITGAQTVVDTGEEAQSRPHTYSLT